MQCVPATLNTVLDKQQCNGAYQSLGIHLFSFLCNHQLINKIILIEFETSFLQWLNL